MLMDKQKTSLNQVIVDERISKTPLYKKLRIHDVIVSEIFSYCIEDDEFVLYPRPNQSDKLTHYVFFRERHFASLSSL